MNGTDVPCSALYLRKSIKCAVCGSFMSIGHGYKAHLEDCDDGCAVYVYAGYDLYDREHGGRSGYGAQESDGILRLQIRGDGACEFGVERYCRYVGVENERVAREIVRKLAHRVWCELEETGEFPEWVVAHW